MTFLYYESLTRSLPQRLRTTAIKSFEKPSIPFKLQLFFNHTSISKHSISLLTKEIHKKCDKSEKKLQQKWIRDVGFHEQGTLLKVQRATRSVYFIYLHYRIINRIIATNTYLVNPRTGGGGVDFNPPPLRFFADSEKTAARSAAKFAIAVQPTI